MKRQTYAEAPNDSLQLLPVQLVEGIIAVEELERVEATWDDEEVL